MELELVPVILGAFVALVGLGLVADGWLPDSEVRVAERRRRARAERNRGGEVLIGVGLLALAAALVGRDVWRFGTVAVLVGIVCLVAGAAMNRHFLVERLLNRGKARRGRRRERRADQAAERPVPLVVAGDADRRGSDRRDHAVDVPRQAPPAGVQPPMPASRAPAPGERPISRRALSD